QGKRRNERLEHHRGNNGGHGTVLRGCKNPMSITASAHDPCGHSSPPLCPAHGETSKPSSSRRWNGWTGSTIEGSWSPSATSRPPKPNNATTPCWNNRPWRPNLNQIASGKPGAVQIQPAVQIFGKRSLAGFQIRPTLNG